MKRLNTVGAVASAIAMAAGVAQAFDADTVALYDFKDGLPGESTKGVTIKNAVDSSVCPGRPFRATSAGRGRTARAFRPIATAARLPGRTRTLCARCLPLHAHPGQCRESAPAQCAGEGRPGRLLELVLR